ncbi:MAG: dermonecrotic toxin domain-containing protein [Luteibacter jiangsuensis]
MLPPQAPPAHIASTNQAAIDTLQRMRDTQAWLVQQQGDLPDLPASRDERHGFLTDLDAFWNAAVEAGPGKSPISRRQAMALRLAHVMRDDASLRRNDGTLPVAAAEGVASIARYPGTFLPSHLHAQELMVGSVPYAGALILSNDRDPQRVLLFTVEAGWRVFESLEVLYRDVELLMRQQLVGRDELPGIGAGDILPVLSTHFLSARAIDDDLFGTLVRRLSERLRERVAAAFDRPIDAANPEQWRDNLFAAMDLNALLDVHAIVSQRDLALAAQWEMERLAEQPTHVREHWLSKAQDYRDVSQWLAKEVRDAMPSLAEFAQQRLDVALREKGIAVSSSHLRVRLTRRVLDKGPIATGISGFAHEELSLLALAYRNLSSLPVEGLEVIDAGGSPNEAVPAKVLRDIVRDLDLPHAYAQHLDETLSHGEAGAQRRASRHTLQVARMRFEAAEARLSYYDLKEPRVFRANQERAFKWIQAVLDSPSPGPRDKVEGHEIVVSQLAYKGFPLADVFLIAPRQTEAVSHVVLYTPDAPDGLAFREFSDRQVLNREILLNPRFEAYLLARLPASLSVIDGRGDRHFAHSRINGDRTWSWVFNVDECPERQRCTMLEERFQERQVSSSFLDADDKTAIDLAKRNAGDMARSTAQVDWDSVKDVSWGWNVPVQLAKEFVVGAVQSIPHTAQASWRFYDHVKAGEGTEAFLAFVEGYNSALAALPLYTQVPAMAGARVRAAFGSRVVVSSQRALPTPDTLFAKRYIARNVSAPTGQPPASGVYTMEGRSYIQQSGNLYQVRFDRNMDTWRLMRPGAEPSAWGPAIERLPDGQWRFHRVGLLGGYGELHLVDATLLQEAKSMMSEGTYLTPEVATLTESQRVTLIETLHRNLPFEEFAPTLRIKIDARPHPGASALLEPQLTAWNEAMVRARATDPRVPPSMMASDWFDSVLMDQAASPGTSAASIAREPARVPTTSSAMPSTSSSVPSTSSAVPSTSSPVSHRAPAWLVSRNYRVAVKWWPEVAYLYLPDPRLLQAQARGIGHIRLAQMRILGTDAQGIPLTTLPPDTLMSQVPSPLKALLPRNIIVQPGATLGSTYGNWVQVNLRNLNVRPGGQAHHQYALQSVPGAEGHGYCLRPLKASPAYRDMVFDNGPVVFIGNEFELGSDPR